MKYKDAESNEQFIREDYVATPDCPCSMNPNTILKYLLLAILAVLILKAIHLIYTDKM
jgi:hypothetical protein